MFDRIKEEIETAQTRLRDVSEKLNSRSGGGVRSARHQAHLARGESQERLWKLEHQALDLVDTVLDRAEDLPGASRVTDPIERLVGQRRTNSLANPVEGYDALNARSAANAVRELEWVELLRVQRYEADNKKRKTVFEAIERRRVQLNKQPFVGEAAA